MYFFPGSVQSYIKGFVVFCSSLEGRFKNSFYFIPEVLDVFVCLPVVQYCRYERVVSTILDWSLWESIHKLMWILSEANTCQITKVKGQGNRGQIPPKNIILNIIWTIGLFRMGLASLWISHVWPLGFVEFLEAYLKVGVKIYLSSFVLTLLIFINCIVTFLAWVLLFIWINVTVKTPVGLGGGLSLHPHIVGCQCEGHWQPTVTSPVGLWAVVLSPGVSHWPAPCWFFCNQR